MCVIAIVEGVRPTDEHVKQMWEANPKGGGVAWREGPDGERKVRWKKGLFLDDMIKLNQELPLPYILHFRVPSSGTSQLWQACHPFEVSPDAEYDFEGETENHVLFHNGFWTGWKEKIQQIAISGYVRVPSGPWSDSRGLAWAAYHLGLGILDMIDEKVVAFGPHDEDIDIFGTWMQLKVPVEGEDPGIVLVSNKSWEKTTPIYPHMGHNSRTLEAAKQTLSPTVEEPGGAPQPGSFRGVHNSHEGTVTDGHNQQEAVQQGSKQVSQEEARALVNTCQGCGKPTFNGIIKNDKKQCWQCWSADEKKKVSEVTSPFIGKCEFCRVEWAAMKVFMTDKWICRTCHETNGKPGTYLAREMSYD
jgi:cytochrome c553